MIVPHTQHLRNYSYSNVIFPVQTPQRSVYPKRVCRKWIPNIMEEKKRSVKETKRNNQKTPQSIGRQDCAGKIRKKGAGISLPTSHPPPFFFMPGRRPTYSGCVRQVANTVAEWTDFFEKLYLFYLLARARIGWGIIRQPFFFFPFPPSSPA